MDSDKDNKKDAGSRIKVSVAEVVEYLRITGGFAPGLTKVLERKLVARAARDAGIRVRRSELQKAADRFRASKDLHKARETNDWLEASGVSVEAFENYLRTSVLISKFKDRLASKSSKKVLKAERVTAAIRDEAYRTWLAELLRDPGIRSSAD